MNNAQEMPHKPSRTGLWLLLSLVLVALLLVGGYYAAVAWSAQQRVAHNSASTLVSCARGWSQVSASTGGLPTLAVPGGRLADGVQVRVPRGGELCLDTGNRARVRIVGPAEFTTTHLADLDQAELALTSGRLYAEVHKLAPQQTFVVTLPKGRRAEVRGTRFELDLYTVATALNVVDGVVSLTQGALGGVDVPAGFGSYNPDSGTYQLDAAGVERVMALTQIPLAEGKTFDSAFTQILQEGLPRDNPMAPLYGLVEGVLAPLVAALQGAGSQIGTLELGDDGRMAFERPLHAALTLRGIERAVGIYRESFGRLPVHLEDLGEEPELLVDPWGRAYIYRLDAQAPSGYQLFSSGKDGVADTDDDIR